MKKLILPILASLCILAVIAQELSGADIRKNGQTSNVVRFYLTKDGNAGTLAGNGLTGIGTATSGLIISTIADTEATATNYTAAGGSIETITTLGTYAAPTSGKVRLKEVDSTNLPGLYEFQIADARFAVSNAKHLIVSVIGAASLSESRYEIELVSFDPFDATRMGLTALPNANAGTQGGLLIVGANTGTLSLSGVGTYSGGLVLGGSLSLAGVVNSASTSLAGVTSTGSLNLGSVNITGLTNSGSINSGSLNLTGIINTGSFSTGSISATGTSTFGTIAISNQLSAGSASLGNIAGTLSFATNVGSVVNNVGSVLTSVGSVIATVTPSGGNVGSVTGNIGGSVGSVLTSVGSVLTTVGTLQNATLGSGGVLITQGTGANQISLSSGAVTAGTVSDKTGYTLTVTPPTSAQIATAIWQDLVAGSDFTASGSVGSLLANRIDATISSRSTYAGADSSGVTTLLNRVPGTLTISGGRVLAGGGTLDSAGTAVAAGGTIASALSVGSVTASVPDSLGVGTLLTRLPGVATINTSGTFSIGGNVLITGGGGGGGGSTAADIWGYGSGSLGTMENRVNNILKGTQSGK